MAELLEEFTDLEVNAIAGGESYGPTLELRMTSTDDLGAQLSRDEVRRLVHVCARWLEETRGERGSCFAVLEYNAEFLERITKVLSDLAGNSTSSPAVVH